MLPHQTEASAAAHTIYLCSRSPYELHGRIKDTLHDIHRPDKGSLKALLKLLLAFHRHIVMVSSLAQCSYPQDCRMAVSWPAFRPLAAKCHALHGPRLCASACPGVLDLTALGMRRVPDIPQVVLGGACHLIILASPLRSSRHDF